MKQIAAARGGRFERRWTARFAQMLEGRQRPEHAHFSPASGCDDPLRSPQVPATRRIPPALARRLQFGWLLVPTKTRPIRWNALRSRRLARALGGNKNHERCVFKAERMMHLVEILLPLNDNNGRPFRTEKYAAVREHLTERFGGLTAFSRSPAQGTTSDGGKTVHDEIIVFEVMAETLDASWWRGYRLQLEREFRQDEIVVRASSVTLL